MSDFSVNKMSRPNEGAGQVGQMGQSTSTAHRLWWKVGRIFPEVVDVGVGIGHEMGVLSEVEVVLQDGDDALGDIGITGKCCVVEAVLAIAVWIIEALALRRAAESFGLGQRVKVDDGDLLHHQVVIGMEAGEADVHGIVGAVLADFGGYEASFPGQWDALEVVLDGQADDLQEGLVGSVAPDYGVFVGNHRLWSLLSTTPSMSLMISWVTSWMSHWTVSSVSSSLQLQNSNLS